MSGPEDPKCLRRNPQIYRLIDAKLFDHVWSVSVTSDHLTWRGRIASSAPPRVGFLRVEALNRLLGLS